MAASGKPESTGGSVGGGGGFVLGSVGLLVVVVGESEVVVVCSSVVGVGVGGIIDCIDDDDVITGVIDDGVTEMTGVDVMKAVELGVGVGVGVDVWRIVVATSVDVIKGMIISSVELTSMFMVRDVVVDSSVTAVDEDVCPLTSLSVNTNMNKPIHLLHCLVIFSDSA